MSYGNYDQYEEDEDLPCECVRIDVDLDDNRDCPAHGPNSQQAKQARQQEADDEGAAAARIPYLLGIDPREWEGEF